MCPLENPLGVGWKVENKFCERSNFSETDIRSPSLEPMNLWAGISGKYRHDSRTETQNSRPLDIWGREFVMIERQQAAVAARDRQQMAAAPRRPRD